MIRPRGATCKICGTWFSIWDVCLGRKYWHEKDCVIMENIIRRLDRARRGE